MSKKLLISLIIIFILAGGLLGLYLVRQQQGPSSGETSFWGSFFGGSQDQAPDDTGEPFPNDDAIGGESPENPEIAPISLFDKPGLTLLANGFVGGAAFANDNSIRYAMRDTGNLFSFTIASGTTARYSNVTVPATYHAQFSQDGNTVLTSSNERGVVVHSVLTTVGSSTKYLFLPQELLSPSLSPDGSRIVYLERGDATSRIRVQSLTKKVPDTTIYTSALGDLSASWVTNALILVQHKASYKKDGIALLINASTGSVSDLGPPLRGLTALPHETGNRALIGSIDVDENIILSAFEKGVSTTLPVKTFPEKCAWSNVSLDVAYCAVPTVIPSKNLPDAWWKGEVSFTDELWKFDLKTGTANRLYDSTSMDIVELFASTKDEVLLFRNKKNASLWAFNLQVSE